MPAHACAYGVLNGINAQGDHLLLTPNVLTTAVDLDYSIQYRSNAEEAFLVACNPTADVINDGTTRFNLLVIDAQ